MVVRDVAAAVDVEIVLDVDDVRGEVVNRDVGFWVGVVGV